MLVNRLIEKSSSVFIIQGIKRISEITTATIFGMKVRVCSWIEVAVWMLEPEEVEVVGLRLKEVLEAP